MGMGVLNKSMELLASLVMVYSFLGIVVLCMAVGVYFLYGYALKCIGEKAGVEGEWMPFVPIARAVYMTRLVDVPVWYILFLSDTIFGVVSSVLSFVLSMVFKSTWISSFVFLAYCAAVIVFKFFFYSRLYGRFRINPMAGWLNVIPGVSIIAEVFIYLIAFSNSIQYGEYVTPVYPPVNDMPKNNVGSTAPPAYKGVITGVSGQYNGASFEIADGQSVSFGRGNDCNLVFDATAADISRQHLVVSFDGKSNMYMAVDYSSNGTYLEDGTRLDNLQPKHLRRGTMVYLGSSKKNAFILN